MSTVFGTVLSERLVSTVFGTVLSLHPISVSTCNVRSIIMHVLE